MADVTEAIKRLRFLFTSEGADKVADDMTKLSQAEATVTGTTSQLEKATQSLQKQFESNERRFSPTLRAQQDFAKLQTQTNAAVAQNPALQERANAMLANAAVHYDQVSKGQKAMAVATADLNARVQAAASSAGTLGNILSSFGTGGIVAAAGIGATVLALKSMSDMAHEFSEKSR